MCLCTSMQDYISLHRSRWFTIFTRIKSVRLVDSVALICLTKSVKLEDFQVPLIASNLLRSKIVNYCLEIQMKEFNPLFYRPPVEFR